jgi:hypothetical protein
VLGGLTAPAGVASGAATATSAAVAQALTIGLPAATATAFGATPGQFSDAGRSTQTASATADALTPATFSTFTATLGVAGAVSGASDLGGVILGGIVVPHLPAVAAAIGAYLPVDTAPGWSDLIAITTELRQRYNPSVTLLA